MDPAAEARSLDEIRARLEAIPDPPALLEQLFAFAPVAFQIYRADGQCLVTNTAFHTLFGTTPPAGYNVLDDEVLRARGVMPLVRRAFAGETVEVPPIWYDVRELRHVSVAAGQRVAIGGTFFPLRDRTGTVAFVAMVFRDVTAELKRQEQLDAEGRRVDFLARTSRILSSSLDLETTLKAIVQAAVPDFADWCFVDLVHDGSVRRMEVAHADPALAGVAARIQMHPPSRTGSPDYPPHIALRGRSVLVAEVGDAEMRAMAADDAHLETLRAAGVRSVISVPLLVADQVLGSLTFARSSSDRRFAPADLVTAEELGGRAALSLENARLYAEAQRTSASLAEASRAKDEFLAMLGHELRNPLSPIVTALEIIRLRGGDAFARERTVIHRQVDHLVRLVDDLLDVSRITRGKIELRRRIVEAGEIVAKAVETASPLLEERHHRLDIAVPSSGLTVEGDETRLAQVVTNLLTNAAKYTDPGGRITIAAARDGDHVEIRVRDTGAGIAPELLPHVFDTFVQGGRRIDRSLGGLGLGLALVRTLTALHGGSVRARSDGPGAGSEFAVRLPFRDGAPAGARPAAPAPGPAVRARRVLVVDDNRDAARSLASWFAAHGHTVRIAFDGPGALRVAAELRPELALVDIGLPVMDGYEVAARLRTMPELAGMRLVAVTGYGQPTDRARSAEAGFEEHLVKPVALARVQALVDGLAAGG